MPSDHPLNPLGVALSKYWMEERRYEQIKTIRDKARENLLSLLEEQGGGPVIIVLDGKAYLLNAGGEGLFSTTELPWVITDMSVNPRN